jgi:hypothetical protein
MYFSVIQLPDFLYPIAFNYPIEPSKEAIMEQFCFLNSLRILDPDLIKFGKKHILFATKSRLHYIAFVNEIIDKISSIHDVFLKYELQRAHCNKVTNDDLKACQESARKSTKEAYRRGDYAPVLSKIQKLKTKIER